VGIPRDYVEAYKWLSIAKAGGMEAAKSSLQQLDGVLSLTQIANARQRANAWMAMRRGGHKKPGQKSALQGAVERGNFSEAELATIIPKIARSTPLARPRTRCSPRDRTTRITTRPPSFPWLATWRYRTFSKAPTATPTLAIARWT